MISIPALTLYQPYGSLIAIGAKPCETRHWAPPARLIGKQIAIHAGKKIETHMHPVAEVEAEKVLKAQYDDWPKTLPPGAIVCLATLTGAYRSGGHIPGEEYVKLGEWCECVPGSRPLGGIHMGYPGILFGDHSKGRWLWMLRVEEVLDPPVPAAGRQGIWNWERKAAA